MRNGARGLFGRKNGGAAARNFSFRLRARRSRKPNAVPMRSVRPFEAKSASHGAAGPARESMQRNAKGPTATSEAVGCRQPPFPPRCGRGGFGSDRGSPRAALSFRRVHTVCRGALRMPPFRPFLHPGAGPRGQRLQLTTGLRVGAAPETSRFTSPPRVGSWVRVPEATPKPQDPAFRDAWRSRSERVRSRRTAGSRPRRQTRAHVPDHFCPSAIDGGGRGDARSLS